MSDDIWPIDKLPINIHVKMIVTTGQPKCLILLEDGKIPELDVGNEASVDTARRYVKENFGYEDDWCDVRLLNIYETITNVKDIYIYYSITIAEENKIKRGTWKSFGAEMYNLPQNDSDMVQRSINQWQY